VLTAEGAPPEVAKQVRDSNLCCSWVLFPCRNAEVEGQWGLFQAPLVLIDVTAQWPPWAFPSPGPRYSVSNGIRSSVASGNTKGHVIWPRLKDLTNSKAALGRRGNCFFPACCCFRSSVGRERLFGWVWHSLGAKCCCWRGCKERDGGRKTAALPSVS